MYAVTCRLPSRSEQQICIIMLNYIAGYAYWKNNLCNVCMEHYSRFTLMIVCILLNLCRGQKNLRKGYMGHLTNVANSIVHSKEKGKNKAALETIFSGRCKLQSRAIGIGSSVNVQVKLGPKEKKTWIARGHCLLVFVNSIFITPWLA